MRSGLILFGVLGTALAELIQVKAITWAPFGAEVAIEEDVPAHSLSLEGVKQITRALDKHHVLIFRGLGNRLNMTEHVCSPVIETILCTRQRTQSIAPVSVRWNLQSSLEKLTSA